MAIARPASDSRQNPSGWDEHRISQLRQFRALPLRAKLEAVQGMADVIRRFQQMRLDGAFRSAAPRADLGEGIRP